MRISRLISARPVAMTAAIALGSFGLAATPAMAATEKIDIVSITDFHGHIENAGKLAGTIDGIRAANPNTIFIANGDSIGGSAYVSSIAKDEPTIKILNAMGLQYSSVGNHEFDAGYADLTDRVIPEANWIYQGANVGGATEITDINGKDYWEVEAAGLTIAFVGTVTGETRSIVSQDGIAGLTFADPVAVTNEIAARLKDGDTSNGEADIVIAVMHDGSTVASTVGADVDAVISGHAHGNVETTTASGAPVLEAASFGTHYGHITIETDGTTTTINGNVVPVAADAPVDADIQKMFEDAKAQAEILGAEEVGSTSGLWRGVNADGSENRGTESSLGNVLAEVAYWKTTQMGLAPDFGIINPGGVRANLDQNGDGVVTYGEAYTVQPFGNTIGTKDLTGAQVYTMLEQQFQDGGSRPMLRLGLSPNVTYTYDPAAPKGERIQKVWIDDAEVDLGATYTVASNTFLLTGQDGFTVLAEGTNARESGYIDLDALVDYLRATPDLGVPDGQRSVGVTLPEGGINVGHPATIELSSLSFTNKEVKPTTVTLLNNGTVVGSAPVNNDITPSLDHTGKAKVALSLPKTFDGKLDVQLTYTDGSTDITPITVPFTPFVDKGAFIDLDGDGISDVEFEVGREGDEVLVGDWNGDKRDTFALRRGNQYFVFNSLRPGNADAEFTFGKATDEVIVGDWNGDGKDTFAVRRGNEMFVINSLKGGNADTSFTFGKAADEAFAGDWDGDGYDTFGLRRGNDIFLSNSLKGGNADVAFAYGRATDTLLIGDFNGDGKDTLTVRRGNVNFINNSLKGGTADRAYSYGRATDQILVGDWNGDGTDTLSLFRR